MVLLTKVPRAGTGVRTGPASISARLEGLGRQRRKRRGRRKLVARVARIDAARPALALGEYALLTRERDDLGAHRRDAARGAFAVDRQVVAFGPVFFERAVLLRFDVEVEQGDVGHTPRQHAAIFHAGILGIWR